MKKLFEMARGLSTKKSKSHLKRIPLNFMNYATLLKPDAKLHPKEFSLRTLAARMLSTSLGPIPKLTGPRIRLGVATQPVSATSP